MDNASQGGIPLTTGTTKPPSPNEPISGKRGDVDVFSSPGIVHVSNNSLVDNAFSAPGVSGCGGTLSTLLDPAIDLDAGLPAAAGRNTAILNGSFDETTPRLVTAELALPEFGRCQKAPGTKVEGSAVYHGAYSASNCVEESQQKLGKFEWVVGPGAKNKFTGESKATTLETTGGARIKCLASRSAGEYTGPKTARVTATFIGCGQVSTKRPCQSAGATSGEVVTSALEGHLGFIKDKFAEGPEVSAGLDLGHEPSLIAAECGGSGPTLLTVSGSVIAPFSVLDKMTTKWALKYKATAGLQAPEAFEGEAKDTLVATLASGPEKTVEQAGLTAADSITNEEKLEIKAEAE